ncbi:MAG: serine hydrolase [Coleofasciculus sp. S288]|nr:serine hydrolase [Coleofasciculus sp. S288]
MIKRTWTPIKRIGLGLVGAVLFFSLSGLPYLAQGEPTHTSQLPILSPEQPESVELDRVVPPRPTRQEPIDPQEVEAFMDEFFEWEMQQVPGAVVALVKDGAILFTKGYGYADVDKKTPVVPDKTLFRVASLSKLFTSTAVMQLSERGLLDLHKDVNQYLKRFQIENPYPEPITTAHLLTQTDGSSQQLFGIAARTALEMMPLEEFIPNHMPPIVERPGEFYSYSNLGITLAGYLVEVLSGKPFMQYMDENLLQPLDMRHSTFRQPLPPSLASDLAVSYEYKDGQFHTLPFLHLNIAPAASMSATATDMAHFMIAHLQNGRYKNSRILEEKTAQLMHQQHFTHHPKLPGTAYGFHELFENNIRAIGHFGGLRGYSCSLLLLPDQNVGLFVATNSFNLIYTNLITQFFDHYYPLEEKPTLPKPLANFAEQAKRFTGTYRDIEYPRGTLASIGGLARHLQVKLDGKNSLIVKTSDFFFAGNPVQKHLMPVEPLLFQRLDDDAYAAFEEDRNGYIRYLYHPIAPRIGAFEKIAWYETIPFQLGLVGFYAVLFLSAGIAWLVYKQRSQKRRFIQLAWLVAGLVGTLNLVFLIGFPLAVWLIGIWNLLYGVPAILIALLCIPAVTTGMTLALPTFTVLVWKNNYGSVIECLHYSLITLTALAFIPFLLYWNLLGFQF